MFRNDSNNSDLNRKNTSEQPTPHPLFHAIIGHGPFCKSSACLFPATYSPAFRSLPRANATSDGDKCFLVGIAFRLAMKKRRSVYSRNIPTPTCMPIWTRWEDMRQDGRLRRVDVFLKAAVHKVKRCAEVQESYSRVGRILPLHRRDGIHSAWSGI